MRDLKMVGNNPFSAKSNKKPKGQAKNNNYEKKASGSKGKSTTGKGKKSRKFWNCQLLSN